MCKREHAPGDAACPATVLPPARQAPASPHLRLGNYEILSVVGRGGMSVVFKARHRIMRRVVAIKMLHSHLVMSEQNIKRFQQEARAAASISHPHVLTVHDFGINEEGHPYLVMDYLEGRSLSDIVKSQGRMPVEEALDVFIQACDALYHAHQQGIIHRDLKPSNIMLIESSDGQMLVKIVDFGIAKIMPREGEDSLGLTQTGEVFGSPLYMSPEQCMGQLLDHRSDIYSFGCVMYETLCGKPPFVGAHVLETLHKHMNEPAPPLALKGCPDFIAERLDGIIFKALEKDQSRRHQSMLQLKHELEALRLPAGAAAAPVSANKVSQLIRQLRRWRGAHPRVRALALVIVLSTLAGLAASKMMSVLALPGVYALPAWVVPTPPVVPKPEDFDQVERKELQYISLLMRINDPGAKERILAESDLARRYARHGMWPQAAKLYRQALALVDEHQGSQTMLAADTAGGLAEAYTAQGLLDKAEPLYERVVSIRSRLSGGNSRQLAQPLSRLGDIYYSKGKLDRAAALYERVMNIQSHYSLRETSSFALAAAKLGEIYASLGRLVQAENLLRNAIEYWKKVEGPDRRNLVRATEKLARVLADEGKYAEAESEYEEALRASSELAGDSKPYMLAVLTEYARFLWHNHRWIEAIRLRMRAAALIRQRP